MKILIIDAEKKNTLELKKLLSSNGYKVESIDDGITGLEYAKLGIYDLIILDTILPGIDGYQLTQSMRENHCGVPILMLTAKSALEDRVKGLNAGADYYLTKPFDKRELLACIHALLRRQGSQVDELVYGSTSLNLSSGNLACGDRNVRLSAKEFDVMRLLLQNPEHNISKELILAHAWGYDSNAMENHVEVFIGFLRKKLLSINSDVKIITIRRMGYHLEINTTK